MKKKIYYLYGFIGIIGLWLFIDHLHTFSFPYYFYNEHPDITKFTGVNVVSMWADFSYFTYHSLIFYSLWCLIQFINHFFKIKWVSKFINSEKVFTFITANYLLTLILYIAFECLSGFQTLSLYGNTAMAIHNFGTNIFVHFVFGIFTIINYFKFKPVTTSNKYYFIPICLYLLTYFAIVKVIGKFCYCIEWYPYFIFDAESILEIFNLPSYNIYLGICLQVIICFLIVAFYLVTYKVLMKWKRKQINSKDNNT